MKKFLVGNVTVICNSAITKKEASKYIAHIQDKIGKSIKELKITVDGDYVDLNYVVADVPFERIRRITGYLTGNLESWNNAKKAEEKDRVKHS